MRRRMVAMRSGYVPSVQTASERAQKRWFVRILVGAAIGFVVGASFGAVVGAFLGGATGAIIGASMMAGPGVSIAVLFLWVVHFNRRGQP